eukprot:3853265-Prymnesium_polylepis.1
MLGLLVVSALAQEQADTQPTHSAASPGALDGTPELNAQHQSPWNIFTSRKVERDLLDKQEKALTSRENKLN